MIPFQTDDYDVNLGFVERVNQIVFPDLQAENLIIPHRNYIINGLILAQTHIACLRESNVSFFEKSESHDNCNVSIIDDAPRGRIHGVFAFKPCQGCTRQRYEQKSTATIMRYVDKWSECGCASEGDICNARLRGDQACDDPYMAGDEDDTEFLCAEKIFAYGVKQKLYLAPRFPCSYIVGVHWEGLKREYSNADLVVDDNDVIDMVALYLEGEKALRLDRDMDRWREIMRKPNLDRRDPGGVFWQRLADVAHRCREERRIRKTVWNEDLFDDSALSHFNVSALDPLPVLPDDDCYWKGFGYDVGYCGPYQFELDGVCHDCVTPIVDLVSNVAAVFAGQPVQLSWQNTVVSLPSSRVTLEYDGNTIVLENNSSGLITVNPQVGTIYIMRAVTACGDAISAVNIAVTQPCFCPDGLPDCLQLAKASPADFGACAAPVLDLGDSTQWDGTLPRISDCKWGRLFPAAEEVGLGGVYANFSNGEALVEVIIELISCDPFVYEMSFALHAFDGVTKIIFWKGRCEGHPVGNFISQQFGVGVSDPYCYENTNFEVEGCVPCVIPVLRMDPPAGSHVNFPTVVFLHSTNDTDLIFYRIDAAEWILYTGPISLSEGQFLSAQSFTVLGCVSAIVEDEYISDIGLEFSLLCDSPNDKTGQFYEFYPDGEANDYHWRIRLTRTADWTLHRAIIYETNAAGVWVTGQAWATINPIFPIEISPTAFPVYPLVLFNDIAQLNSSYGQPLANYLAGVRQLDAYGQPFVALTEGYFRLELTIDEGGYPFTIFKLITHNCPPCADVVAPDVVADCDGVVHLTGKVTAGSTYRILRAIMPPCGSGVFTDVFTGIAIGTSTIAFTDSGLIRGCDYSYIVSEFCAANEIWINSPSALASVPTEVECQPPPVCVPSNFSTTYSMVPISAVDACGYSDDALNNTNGVMTQVPGSCTWVGKFQSPSLAHYYSLALAWQAGVWKLYLGAKVGNQNVTVLALTKTTGPTPAGTYTANCACCTPPGALSIEVS